MGIDFGSAKTGSSVSESSAINCESLPDTLHADVSGCTVSAIVPVHRAGAGLWTGYALTDVCGQSEADGVPSGVSVEIHCNRDDGTVDAHVNLNNGPAPFPYDTNRALIGSLPIDVTLNATGIVQKPCFDGGVDCELTVSITE